MRVEERDKLGQVGCLPASLLGRAGRMRTNRVRATIVITTSPSPLLHWKRRQATGVAAAIAGGGGEQNFHSISDTPSWARFETVTGLLAKTGRLNKSYLLAGLFVCRHMVRGVSMFFMNCWLGCQLHRKKDFICRSQRLIFI